MGKDISISESEWRVMKVIWEEPPKTLQDILAKLKHTEWSTTTIQTYLARLVKKGALETERQGKGYLYFPAISESECQTAEGKTFLSRVYDGSLSRMVSGFVKNGDISKVELQEIKRLIGEQERNNADTR